MGEPTERTGVQSLNTPLARQSFLAAGYTLIRKDAAVLWWAPPPERPLAWYWRLLGALDMPVTPAWWIRWRR